ncbi:MAG: glutamate racemase [Nitrosopumilales archaeon CG_4_10_14_0_8_um_filter_34_8]|nr:MAG: glutamate racemase [Nitrosopumilales archaeon CG_4_10_14_0_8_um_filter_34_8]
MVKIAVFDSGLGSLSIINAIQKRCKSEIIYFADQKNFPYGNKSKKQLDVIIKQTIRLLEENFSPDVIVMASNTPSLMVRITNRKVIGVNPPIRKAMMLSKTKNIAILGTKAAVKSKSLSKYIRQFNFSKDKKIYKINSSILVNLVESNKFVTNKTYCKKIIRKTLTNVFSNDVDVATLSSTHLSFLRPLLSSEFPQVKFIDPADIVASNVLAKIKKNKSKKNTIKIFTSGNAKLFQKNLNKLGIKNKVNFLST